MDLSPFVYTVLFSWCVHTTLGISCDLGGGVTIAILAPSLYLILTSILISTPPCCLYLFSFLSHPLHQELFEDSGSSLVLFTSQCFALCSVLLKDYQWVPTKLINEKLVFQYFFLLWNSRGRFLVILPLEIKKNYQI